VANRAANPLQPAVPDSLQVQRPRPADVQPPQPAVRWSPKRCVRRMGEAPIEDLLGDWNMTEQFHVEQQANPHLRTVPDEWQAITKLMLRLANRTERTLQVLDIGGSSGKSYERNVRSLTNYTSLDLKIPGAAINTGSESLVSSLVGNIVRCNAHLPSSKFDVVMALDTFQHILAPAEAAKEMVRLVRNGGFLIVAAPFSRQYHASPMDMMRYTHTALRYYFESTGDVRTLHTSYVRNPFHEDPDHNEDEPMEPSFNEPTNAFLVAQRVDGTPFEPDSLDHNLASASGRHVEGLPDPPQVDRCAGADAAASWWSRVPECEGLADAESAFAE